MMARYAAYVAIILLASAAAAAGYAYFRQPAVMLVLQIRTMEKGARRIQIIDTKGVAHERRFEIGNDLGEPSFYPVELPRISPYEISIEPLAAPGRFAVDRVTLKSAAFNYSWDSRGSCSSMTLPQGTIKREACSGNAPLLTTGADAKMVLSRLPQMASGRERGMLAGSLAFIAVLFAGGWLLQPLWRENPVPARHAMPARLCWLVVIAVYLIQFAALWRYSVDVPFWEEWEYFLPNGLPKGLSLDWLFSFAGYHRVVPTKFMAWLNLEFFGLDFRLQKLCNYLLFGCMLTLLVSLKNRLIGRHEFVLFPAFLLFLLSPIVYENHTNSYQSQIHLVIIFALVALQHIYADRLTAKPLTLFFISLVAAINTFSAGMTIAAVLLPCWAVFVFVQIANGRIQKKTGVGLLLSGAAMVSVTAASWLLGYRQPADADWISPFTSLFWDTFLNLLSFGFGVETEHPLPGAVCLAVILLPLLLLWQKRELRRQPVVWQSTTGVLLVLAILATISITRGSFIGTPKVSRYAEFGLLLIPLTAISWWLALPQGIRRYGVLLLLWVSCCISFSDDWSFSPYREGAQMDTFVLEALEDYSRGRGDGVFPWTHPKPLPPFFEGARRLDVKFTRQFRGLRRESE